MKSGLGAEDAEGAKHAEDIGEEPLLEAAGPSFVHWVLCNLVEGHPFLCTSLQFDAIPCIFVYFLAVWADPCGSMEFHAVWCAVAIHKYISHHCLAPRRLRPSFPNGTCIVQPEHPASSIQRQASTAKTGHLIQRKRLWSVVKPQKIFTGSHP